MYRSLQSDQILATVERLSRRIDERFPESSLSKVCHELRDVARKSAERCHVIAKPYIPLRVASVGAGIVLVVTLCLAATKLRYTSQVFELGTFLQSLDAFLESTVYAGALVIFLVTLENRLKRRRALDAIHEMRSLAHIVDMHQLTKDPDALLFAEARRTQSSPQRQMTPYELSRYFDYCSEMLSLISKLAALYVQSFKDPVAMTAVDQVEDLTTSLSQKIWQKSSLLSSYATSGGKVVGHKEAELTGA